MSLLYLLPPLPHQEGMVDQPEFGRPAERHDEVPHDHEGLCLISLRSPIWIREGNPWPIFWADW